MKKIIVTIMALFLCAGIARAEVNLPDLLKKLPALNQSMIYSIPDAEFDYATSITLISLLDKKINIDIGYSPKTELLGLASFKLIEIGKWITFPILDKIIIEPFIWAGVDRIEDLKELGEADYGVGCKIISLKF